MRPLRIFVFGDFVTDKYTRVKTTRGCPERPEAPVFDHVETVCIRPGCAGNVVQNAIGISQALFPGSRVTVGGTMGTALYLSVMQRDKPTWNINQSALTLSDDIVKERFLVDDTIQFRIDSTRRFSNEPRMNDLHATADVAIISDYGFGGVNESVAQSIINSVPVVVVDSKREDLSIFKGASVVKLNKDESSRQLLANLLGIFDNVVMSRGAEGCSVIGASTGNQLKYDRGFPQHEVDVTGCGDTFTAALALYYAATHDIIGSARKANFLASRVVGKLGPAVPSEEDIEDGRKEGIL